MHRVKSLLHPCLWHTLTAPLCRPCCDLSLTGQLRVCSSGHIRRLARLSPVDSLLFTVCAVSMGQHLPVRALLRRWMCRLWETGVLGGGEGGRRGVWQRLLSREPMAWSPAVFDAPVLKQRQHREMRWTRERKKKMGKDRPWWGMKEKKVTCRSASIHSRRVGGGGGGRWLWCNSRLEDCIDRWGKWGEEGGLCEEQWRWDERGWSKTTFLHFSERRTSSGSCSYHLDKLGEKCQLHVHYIDIRWWWSCKSVDEA